MMTLYSTDKTALMEIQSIQRSGNDLLIQGKVFGTMPMTARLTPVEARRGFGLLSVKLVLFILSLPFRRG
jgi:hypothetical protein